MPYVKPVITSLAGGVDTTASPEDLQPNTAVAMSGIDLGTPGAIKSRTGTLRVLTTPEGAPITGIFGFGNMLIYVFGGSAKYLGVGTEIY